MRQTRHRPHARINPGFPTSDALTRVVSAIGGQQFSECMFGVLGQYVKHDIIGAYVIGSGSDMHVLFANGGVPTIPEFSKIAAPRYATDFWKQDPAVRRFLCAPSKGLPNIALQRWNEIPSGEYRAFAYERPDMLERFSFFKTFHGGSVLLSLYRTHDSGHFSHDELGLLERQSELLVASTIRHWELLQSHSALRPDPSAVARQIGSWMETLSVREVETCAALLSNSSVKLAIHSTGLQPNTFLTYRKRAFEKLGIKTRAELEQLYERRYDVGWTRTRARLPIT